MERSSFSILFSIRESKARKNGNTDEFKASFYDLDLLLIDDIQFIAGKEWTQEVFFSIFN